MSTRFAVLSALCLGSFFGIASFASAASEGPIVGGGPKNLPNVVCIVADDQGVQRSFAIYQTNFSTGNPETDRFEGIYFRREGHEVVKLACLRGAPGAALLWRCGQEDARLGAQRAQVLVDRDGAMKVRYFERDRFAQPGRAPDDVISCRRLVFDEDN